MSVIRPLAPEDAPRWRALWRGYLDFYGAALPGETYAQTFARLLPGGSANMRALIAERDGAPAGLVHFIFHDHCWRPEGVTYLQDLYVDPSARGAGLGRALIEAVYAAADQAGRPTVYWLTQEFNHAARALYDRVAERTPFIKYARAERP
ncbi:GNAT family N-acetyltransferase [Oceanicella actignis]|uniref:GNAT family N-acetyltransferase n=1 Tax=Oceanicella actignis TaxID=1189325 RepID=UPI0011E6A7AC|nr:GNAT family N-acetyltransferase [Oceanicella actignis]TYO89890.1 acetyltransferase (GNAT) family protein [Oceanicella actignis]